MQKRVRLTRFNKDIDGNAFWLMYQDESNREFFRRFSPTMTKPELLEFEQLSQATLLTVLWDEFPVGFAVVTSIDPLALTCQIGLMLEPEFRDKLVDGYKIAFWAMFRLCSYLFNDTPMRKVSMRFLKIRTDIEESLKKGGFKKEAELRDSTYCYGKFQDELEYALMKTTLIEPRV